jgi:transcriptional regulator with XRE-family HTH domain
MSETPTDPLRREFAARLNRLFASILDDNGKEYSNEEVARRADVSAVYIGLLRRELRNPPTPKVARRIELVFGVEQPYLLSEDPSVVQAMDAKLATLRDMQERGVWQLAMRASNLTPAGLAMLNDALNYVEEREGARQTDELGSGPGASPTSSG